MQSTRRGSFSVHRSEKTPGSKYSSTSGLSPRGHLERQAEFPASTQDEAWLSCPPSAGTLQSESEIRGTLRFLPQLEMRPSSNAPNPVESREAPPSSSFPDFSEPPRSEEHTSDLQSPTNLVCRLLLEKKKKSSTKAIADRQHHGEHEKIEHRTRI